MSFPLALLLVALSGFISLSYEILWYRACSFVSESSPASFGFLLGAYLSGIALGSLGSRAYCKDRASTFDPRHLRALSWFVLSSSALGFLVVPAMARLVVFTGQWMSSLLLVALAAGSLGAILPLLSHFGIAPDDRAGARLSYLYMANIAGSATGSLVTGFVLMDHLSMQGISTFLFLAGGGVSIGLLLLARRGEGGGRLASGGVALACSVAILASPALFKDVYARLLWKGSYGPDKSFEFVIENRSGVITVTRDGTIYGGGVYDGVFSTDLVHDRNSIVRPYAISAFHPAPKRVLMVGLASGSWAQVVANHPDIESLTVIEINPGYMELLPRFPAVASLLHNPKVDIVIDDGRRWLARHPDRKFDVIVQNTTWYFHDHVTNLLSAEYLDLARSRLAPGGVLLYNTTGSRDAQLTAVTKLPFAYRFFKIMVVSDSPIVVDKARWRRVLQAYRVDDQPVFDPAKPGDQARLEEVLSLLDPPRVMSEDEMKKLWRERLEGFQLGGKPYFDLAKEEDRQRIDAILSGEAPPDPFLPGLAKPIVVQALEDRESILAASAGARVITDDNMASEWGKVLH